ncbi:MAG: tRNA 2-thiouridine(34) synthase MnmA [Actinomycetota bacterium]|nr:tRNA 2-thiouridine(34) synthase MnmA [Actinomycetota bacterium]
MSGKVVVAMSGGVDSSVTAALLKEQGYEVIGITMQIWPSDKLAEEADRFGGCCSLAAVDDARRVAFKLDIPYYVINFREIFAQKVIANFCEEYTRGRTPNPCIRCNQHIKFDALLKKAKELNADFIATGHYARIGFDKEKKRYILKKGIDAAKDQSYVLYIMTQEQLAHTLMPLGNLTKTEARRKAAELGLPVAEKPESQEICFIPDNDYGKFLKEYIPKVAQSGPILDSRGNLLGEHKGIIFYTIGQRKGLGISAKEPLYVIAIDRERNAIVVGSEDEVYGSELIAEEVNYISIRQLTRSIKVKAKIRYKMKEAEAVVTPLNGGKVQVKFTQPQRAITPGQAVVFYQDDVVVGGGRIVHQVDRRAR